MRLSAYGYLRHVLDQYGAKANWENIILSQPAQAGYLEDCRRYRDDMRQLLVNASKYVESVMDNIADWDICRSKLQDMSSPYVLYILFAGSGRRDLV